MRSFKFKQFTIRQDQCAMKVGTDGVLLGAWVFLGHNPNSILDIGAGTGLLSLQMAQRSNAKLIDAIEIEENAYEQCVGNFEESSWADRLFCYHAGLNEFVEEMDEKYDLIISNPPFYDENVSSGNVSRDIARQNHSLPFVELLEGVSLLLEPEGFFSVIIPNKAESAFIELASTYNLFPDRITRVRGNALSEIKRSLISFRFIQSILAEDELIIEKARHEYTQEYINLTKEFYLKM